MIKVTGSGLTTTTPPPLPYHIFNISYEFLPLSKDVTPVIGSLYTTSGVSQSFSPFQALWLLYVPTVLTFESFAFCPQTLFVGFI